MEESGIAGIPPPGEITALPSDGGPDFNRLIHEKSPYLLQHARNPVDWYPWSEEAFAKARQEDKPIFLSVGYSTCHWCHVMERESFENDEIAEIMNEHFVAIKVDREERPDVDRVYMTFVQMATGSGGWPMNVWLTPALKPFYGGTYFPPDDRPGVAGLKTVLLQIAESWKKEHERIIGSSEEIIRELRRISEPAGPAKEANASESLLDAGYKEIKASYDPRYGGFGGAPKFPRPSMLNFMLRYSVHATAPESPPGPSQSERSQHTNAEDARDMALFTLRKMADGGIHDHLGGGFHRYSVDERWHVPHFEKMLYDQAQLACTYLDAYQLTGDVFYADTARGTLEYVLREMTGANGQFYSGQDADSPCPDNPARHCEGAFYVWERDEIIGTFEEVTAAIFDFHYGVEKEGNTPGDALGELHNKNVLIVSHTLEETAEQFGKTVDDIHSILAKARIDLLCLRAERPAPYRDDKTITAWNGLMISALARAAQALDEPRYLLAAGEAADFIRTRLYSQPDSKLLRRHRAGQAAIPGYADDYAFLIQGLLDLYEAGFSVGYLDWAIVLQTTQDALFRAADGGYYSDIADNPNILLRTMEEYDGVEPSANSVAALNLLRLSHMTDNEKFLSDARQTISRFCGRLRFSPGAMPQMLVSLDFMLDKSKQIVIAGKADAQDTRALLRAIHRMFIPNKVILLADAGDARNSISRHLSFIKDMPMIDGKATAYVCEERTCKLPTTEPVMLGEILALHLRQNAPS
jgi:uncharacterized protein YyaL (SSP411 family)